MFAINRTSRLLLSSALALAFAGCRDNQLPTGVKPGGALLTQVSSGPVVNSLADPGDGTCDDTECTLREAIAFAAGGATITFATELTGTITVASASGYLLINKNLTISGPGAASLSVSGHFDGRVLYVNSGVTASISGLTIKDGTNPNGGGIFNSGTLTLSQCAVTGNSSIEGGGIYNTGTLTLTNTTVSGNLASGGYPVGGGIYNAAGTVTLNGSSVSGNTAARGAGIYTHAGTITLTGSSVSGNTATSSSGAGIYSNTGTEVTLTRSTVSGNTGNGIYNYQGTLTLTNSTVSGNTSTSAGGGINNHNASATLTNSTVTGNSAGTSEGGGILNTNGAAVLTLTNSLVAGNTANYGPDLRDDDLSGATVNSTYSLIGSAEGNAVANGVNGNIVGVTAITLNLGALADNGGSTKTHALLTGSPAIDAGTNTGCPATDQRGITRPQNGTCDIGSYEYQAGGGLPAPNFTFDLSTLPAKSYGDGSFSVAAYATSTNSGGAKSFDLGSGSAGCSVTSAGMVTVVGAATDASNCIIAASLASDGTYSAAGPLSQSFHIAKKTLTVTAQNETITYGASTPEFGTVYIGFVGDDGLSSLGGALVRTFAGVSPTSYGPSTTAPTNAGTYSITLSGYTSTNYSFTYVPGTYTINKAAGSVSISNLPSSATVGGSFTPTYTKLGDGAVSVSSSTPAVCSVSGGVVSFDAPGTCTLQASVTAGSNHLAATGIEQSFTIGSAATFSSSCTYTTNRKGDLVVSVSWQNADPGVTLIGLSVGATTVTKQTGPRAAGEWTRRLTGSAVPTYELKGGTGRTDASTTLVAAGTACTAVP